MDWIWGILEVLFIMGIFFGFGLLIYITIKNADRGVIQLSELMRIYKMDASEDNFPRTGRIGRFVKIVEKEVPKEIMIKIVQDSDKFNSLSPNKKAEWWNDAINRMKKEIGTDKTKDILSICGSKCRAG